MLAISGFLSTCEDQLRTMIAKLAEMESVDTEQIERLSSAVNDMTLPPNALDLLIDQLGGKDRVAEMTGRSSRMVRDRKRNVVVEKRTNSSDSTTDGAADSINTSERKQFQDGNKLFAVISEAASTGVSLQADNRVKNQRRRLHITLELPWSADKAVQQLGRSHRSNQSSAPIYCLLVSGIGAERRFASAVAARLAQLGALTKGDRRATSNAEDGAGVDSFAIDKEVGAQAIELMYANIRKLNCGGSMAPQVKSTFLLQDQGDSDDSEQLDDVQAICLDKASSFGEHVYAKLIKLQVLDQTGKPLGTKGIDRVKKFLNRLFGTFPSLRRRTHAECPCVLPFLVPNEHTQVGQSGVNRAHVFWPALSCANGRLGNMHRCI